MTVKKIIFSLFIFAFLASAAQAQHAPDISRHQETKHKVQKKKNADAISKRKAYNMSRKYRKATVGKRITKTEKKTMKRNHAKLMKKKGKACRKPFTARKVRTERF